MQIKQFVTTNSRISGSPLHATGLSLKTYTGQNITPAGVLQVNVEYQDQKELLVLYLVKSKGPVFDGKKFVTQDSPKLVCYLVTAIESNYIQS